MTPERGGRRPRDDTYRAKALADPRVRSWWQSQRLGSHITADVNLRQLWAFLIEAKLDPHQLVALAKDEPEKLQEIIVEYADQLVNRGRLASYIAKTFVGVKSWLRFNGVEFHRFPKLKVLQGQSLSKERTPTPAELHRLLGVLDPRGRMIALLMAHAGLRPGVLGSMDGTDGLTLGDLPELTLKGEPAFKRIPFLIVVAGTHSKNRLDYVTFGTQELAEAVLAYLADRQSRGEKLTPASPLVNLSAFASANYNHARVKSDFITTTVITRGLRNAIAKVLPEGVEWRPYVLRAYCSTQLWAAGNHGKIDRDAREAILGHDLGVSGRYNLSKRLHPEMVEELRAAYARCEGYLSTVPTRDDAQGAANATRMLLLGIKYTEEEVARIDLEKLSTEGLQELVAKKLVKPALAPPPPTPVPSPARKHKVVKTGEVARYLDAGWVPVMKLSEKEVVLSPPAA